MSNPWKLLQSLLPADAMQIGTVQAVNADGTSLVSMCRYSSKCNQWLIRFEV